MALFTPTEITDNYAKASIAKAESHPGGYFF